VVLFTAIARTCTISCRISWCCAAYVRRPRRCHAIAVCRAALFPHNGLGREARVVATARSRCRRLNGQAMLIRQQNAPLRFFRTTPSMRCPYLPERASQAADRAGRAGCRSGSRPLHRCRVSPQPPVHLQAALPLLPGLCAGPYSGQRFVPGRAQRRNLRDNEALSVSVVAGGRHCRAVSPLRLLSARQAR